MSEKKGDYNIRLFIPCSECGGSGEIDKCICQCGNEHETECEICGGSGGESIVKMFSVLDLIDFKYIKKLCPNCKNDDFCVYGVKWVYAPVVKFDHASKNVIVKEEFGGHDCSVDPIWIRCDSCGHIIFNNFIKIAQKIIKGD
jgi:hypothetical protein